MTVDVAEDDERVGASHRTIVRVGQAHGPAVYPGGSGDWGAETVVHAERGSARARDARRQDELDVRVDVPFVEIRRSPGRLTIVSPGLQGQLEPVLACGQLDGKSAVLSGLHRAPLAGGFVDDFNSAPDRRRRSFRTAHDASQGALRGRRFRPEINGGHAAAACAAQQQGDHAHCQPQCRYPRRAIVATGCSIVDSRVRILQAERHVRAVSTLQSPTSAMDRPRRLDVLIPTHNRAATSRSAVSHPCSMPGPSAGLDVHITVICNACTDGSQAVVRRLQAAYPRRMSLLEERRRGKSRALNAGHRGDERRPGRDDRRRRRGRSGMDCRSSAPFSKMPPLDFAGGPYVAVWDVAPARLASRRLPGRAWRGRQRIWSIATYRPFFPGILKGGNAVIRRRTLLRVGPFAEHLGPGSFSRLFSCEDEDMYLAPARGRGEGEVFTGARHLSLHR